MNGKQGARSYVDLDPTFEWSRGEETDILRVYLPGFKREYIKVQVDGYGNLRTTGERPQEDNKWVRFWKDFRIPANCNVNTIRAKFEDETLIITLPKEIVRAKPTTEPSQQLPPPSKPAPAPAKPAPAVPPKPAPAVPPMAPAPAVPPKTPAPAVPPMAPAPAVPPKTPAPAVPPKVPAPALPEMPKPAADQAPVPGPVNRPASSKLGEMLRTENENKVDDKPKVATPTPAGPAPVTDKKENEKKEDQRPVKEKVTEEQPTTEATGALGGDAYPPKETTAQRSGQGITTGMRSQQRGLLLNVAAALVVLLGMAIYLSFRLRRIADIGGDHHGAKEL